MVSCRDNLLWPNKLQPSPKMLETHPKLGMPISVDQPILARIAYIYWPLQKVRPVHWVLFAENIWSPTEIPGNRWFCFLQKFSYKLFGVFGFTYHYDCRQYGQHIDSRFIAYKLLQQWMFLANVYFMNNIIVGPPQDHCDSDTRNCNKYANQPRNEAGQPMHQTNYDNW